MFPHRELPSAHAALRSAGWFAAFAGLLLAARAAAQVSADRDDYLGPRPVRGGAVIGVIDREFPLPQYYHPFNSYYDGQYADALEQFRLCARGGRKVPGPWLDAICYHAMLGECYYQMGQLDEALAEYTAALQVAMSYPTWLNRVYFAPQLRAATAGGYGATAWGQSRRNPALGQYPAKLGFQDGEVDNTAAATQGGVVRPAQLIAVNVYEIFRCTCLAIKRRHDIMGPVGYTDPLHQQLVEFYARPTRKSWPGFLLDVALGFAYRAAGKPQQARTVFERCITVEGFDHPYTGMVLLELGQLARAEGNAVQAAEYLIEATYAASYYDEADTVEAAFAELLGLERILNQQRELPPVGSTADWAGKRDLRKLRAMLLLDLAERHATAGETKQAAAILAQADQLVGRRDLRSARGGARLRWVEALIRYQQSNVAEGDRVLAAAIQWQQRGSCREFQLQLLERRIKEGQLTARTAVALYGTLLGEPSADDWSRDPLDALAAWHARHDDAYDTWFLLSWERQRPEDLARLIEITDRARRKRFLSSLELGGRPQSIRWLLAASPEQLAPEMRLQRQDLLVRFPQLARTEQDGRGLQEQFARLASSDQQQLRHSHRELLERWSAHATAADQALRELALRREPAGIAFPPVRAMPEMQRALPERYAVLAFAIVRDKTFGFFVMRDKYQVWEVGQAAKVHDDVAQLLRAWHHTEGRRSLSAAELGDKAWRKLASALLPYLTSGAASDFPGNLAIDDLAIVPDGALWYLPFEALLCGTTERAAPLIAGVRLRYAPTVALAVEPRQRGPVERTAILQGKLVPRQDEAAIAAELESLAKTLPGAVVWRKPIGHAADLAATCSGRLVVLDDLPLDGRKSLDWSPTGINRENTETTLAEWLKLPWPAPRELLLPGFHTAAESGLKNGAADGSELFRSVMGLAGAGSRTMLLSRWRSGGKTIQDELRELVQELPYTSPADAWQRSALLCLQSPLDPARETRLSWKSADPPPAADHPFFWAAPLLIDCGIDADLVPAADPLENVVPD